MDECPWLGNEGQTAITGDSGPISEDYQWEETVDVSKDDNDDDSKDNKDDND